MSKIDVHHHFYPEIFTEGMSPFPRILDIQTDFHMQPSNAPAEIPQDGQSHPGLLTLTVNSTRNSA
jgi:hypothetical protein